ncbi:hypothetical protein A2U01_0078842, partial [Trifolium medium]|nr:hypothetical protein [Trifolium medium]
FKQLGMTLEEVYIEFMGELEEYYEEEKTQAEGCTEYLEQELPPKQKDPGMENEGNTLSIRSRISRARYGRTTMPRFGHN